MTRPRLPFVPLDAQDRRIVAVGAVLIFAFMLLCAAVGAGLGLGVRVFTLLAGG